MNKKAIAELINERGIVEGLSHSISLLGQRIIFGSYQLQHYPGVYLQERGAV